MYLHLVDFYGTCRYTSPMDPMGYLAPLEAGCWGTPIPWFSGNPASSAVWRASQQPIQANNPSIHPSIHQSINQSIHSFNTGSTWLWLWPSLEEAGSIATCLLRSVFFWLVRNVTSATWQPGSFCATLCNQFNQYLKHTTSLDNLDFKFETSLDLSVIDLFRPEFDWVQLSEFVSWILEAVNLNPLGITEANICQTEIPKISRFLDFFADASPAFGSAAPIERRVSFSWDKSVYAFILLRDTL